MNYWMQTGWSPADPYTWRNIMIRILSIVALFGLILTNAFAAEEPGDYKPDTFAISAEGSELNSPISKLSGISPYYHLYDVNGKAVEVLANPHLDLEYGVGPAAAATLADKGVTVLVGGMAGPKMQDVLDARGVRFVRRTGTVEDVVKELRNE
jgi:predicted Fe-Mo cluster-binding NifX family protein